MIVDAIYLRTDLEKLSVNLKFSDAIAISQHKEIFLFLNSEQVLQEFHKERGLLEYGQLSSTRACSKSHASSRISSS